MSENENNKRESVESVITTKRRKTLTEPGNVLLDIDHSLSELQDADIQTSVVVDSSSNGNDKSSNINSDISEDSRRDGSLRQSNMLKNSSSKKDSIFDVINDLDSPNKLNKPLPSFGQISNAFQKRQMKKLTDMLRDVERQLPLEVKKEQQAAQKRISHAEVLISKLRQENLELKEKLKHGKQTISNMKKEFKEKEKDSESEIKRLESIIDDAREIQLQLNSKIHKYENFVTKDKQLENDLHSLLTKSEIIEVLTGLSCSVLEEDAEYMYFSIKQMGSLAEHHYQLAVRKKGDIPSDITYLPDWDKPAHFEEKDWQLNVDAIKKSFPDYLLRDLTFPPNTMHSFFNKLNKCLRKNSE